ncbi:uncharacterized protein LOC117787096 [Drosophila innubila]|uniref:uncharacterized protein LOC117787096 n=1 Tax=Drosophila innubila TaxID=198719 RepID=UPI00148CF3E3|nr:uncharacterized protein LOC117787096 [Drosophila innubila]
MYKFALFLCLALVFSLKHVHGDVFEECANSEEGSFVASWDSCQSYVYCDGGDSLLGQCDDGEYFDSESGACDAATNVKCFLDEVDEPPVQEETNETDEEEEPIEPEPTPPTMEKPTEVDILNIAPVVKPTCPHSDDPSQIILMANNASCDGYYLCYHGHAMEMHCTNQLHFNAQTGQCDYPENAQCVLERPTAHKCLPHMTDFFPHPDKCSYFYYCIKGYLTLQQCPFFYGWDIERRSCVHLNAAKCFGTSRRALIYCNGTDSEYCFGEERCDPSYNCTEIEFLAENITTTTKVPSEDVRAICRRGVTEKYKYPGNFGCLLPGKLVEAAFLWECEGVIITLISNPNQECSEFVHCDGDNSYYCNGECTEPVICNNTTVIATTQSSVNTEAITNVNTEQPTTEHQHPSTPTTDSATTISSNPHSPTFNNCENMHNYTRNCLLLVLLICLWTHSLADVFEQCNADNDQQFILSNRSCTHFILCNGEDSHEGECPEGDRFNAVEQMCELMEDIDCRTGQPINTDNGAVTEAQGNVTAPPVNISTTATTPTSTAVQVPSPSPVNNSTVISSPISSNSQVVTTVASICPRNDNPNQIVLLAHDQSCTDYFICYGGQPISMHCAPTLHFNVRTGKCDKAEIVKCLRSSIAVREQCKKHTVDIYPHPDNCNYFYYCRNGYLMLQQCPFFYGWDYDKRSCVAIRQAKCYGRTRL